ncbi:hypothetical protein GEV33_001418 [Tenebrio molitor]|uniref:Uncharacterized protein n=1 Tax=Tenebrio molitor TaxID=7067 RepID=A0A8J6HXM8_TENMO|nr:hypothetical protein GEV33_001418 [Tenebrio molitor]
MPRTAPLLLPAGADPAAGLAGSQEGQERVDRELGKSVTRLELSNNCTQNITILMHGTTLTRCEVDEAWRNLWK